MSRFDSLLLYIVTYALSAGFVAYSKKANTSKTTKRVLLIVGVLLPTMLAYFRYNVGTDFRTYQMMYRSHSSMGLVQFITSRELLYGWGVWAISKLAALLGGERAFFGLFALLTYGFAIKGFEECDIKDWFLVIFAFLLGPFTSGLNIMKQELAMAIVFSGYKYIYKRDLKRWLLIIIFALMFHTMTLVALPIYFIYNKDENDKIWDFKSCIYILLAVIVTSNILSLLSSLRRIDFMNLSRFSMYGQGEGTGNFSFFIVLAEFLLVLIHQRFLSRINDKNKMLIVSMGLGVVFYTSGFIAVIVKRIATFYTAYQWLVLAAGIPYTVYYGKNRIIVKIAVGLFFIAMFVVSYYVRGWSNIIPYSIAH